jgi:hypothetical protein
LARRLGADGFDVWFDRDIPPGENFDQVIESALHRARAVVVLWSRHSVGSRWVVAEAASKVKLVPVLLDDAVIALEFRRIQAADLIDWNGDPKHPGYRSLVETLRRGPTPTTFASRPCAGTSTPSAHGSSLSPCSTTMTDACRSISTATPRPDRRAWCRRRCAAPPRRHRVPGVGTLCLHTRHSRLERRPRLLAAGSRLSRHPTGVPAPVRATPRRDLTPTIAPRPLGFGHIAN